LSSESENSEEAVYFLLYTASICIISSCSFQIGARALVGR
jgi:hypothetical protein